jgi:thiol:disulfide interchange protein
MKLETKRRLSMLLLAVAVVFWLLRQLAVVYIPGVSALALAGAMLLLASGMDRSRSGQKAAVTLIFAFGLLNILFAIIELYGGGPVGLDTLAANLGEESVTLEDVCEPYLMQMGMLTRTPRGRCVTRLAYEHLNMPVPKHLRAEDADEVDGQQRMY